MSDGKIKEGSIKFYYTVGGDDRLHDIRNHLGWDFKDVLNTKELNLTHNLIAPQAGFGDLMAIYDKDGVLNFRDRIVNFIRKNEKLEDFDELTFGETVSSLQKGKTGAALNAVSPTAGMREFIEAHPDLLADANSRNFRAFRRMYVDKDQLVDDKKQSEEEEAQKGSNRCDFIKHILKIQRVVHLYQQRRYNEFLRQTEFKLLKAADKVQLQQHVETLCGMSDRPILEVVEYAHANGLCIMDDKYTEFVERKGYLHNRLKSVKYRSFQNLYEYLEGRTTFSTQHKIKGNEFNRVLVVLDAGGWNKYNFTYLFEDAGTASVIERTRKLFYVCCTRAKESLAVYFHNPSDKAIKRAEAWFGSENCIKL